MYKYTELNSEQCSNIVGGRIRVTWRDVKDFGKGFLNAFPVIFEKTQF